MVYSTHLRKKFRSARKKGVWIPLHQVHREGGNMKKALEALTVVCLMAVPGLVLAQAPWDFSASLFGGRVTFSNTDIRISDSSVNSDLTAHDVKLDNSTSFGGKLE